MNTDSAPTFRILLAEDHPVNQLLAVKLLQRQGHGVRVVEHGKLALEAWRGGGFDLILMDMMMPVLDGLDATRAIRAEEAARGGHIPIVAMTANAMQGDRERCLAAGMDGYVSKPIRPESLFEEIRRVMNEHTPTTPAPAAPHDAPAYDRAEALARIADDRDLFNDLVDMFLADVDGYLADIRTALEAGDMDVTQRATHTLKGILATFSAHPSQAQALAMEHAASARDAAAARACLPGLEAELARLLPALRQDRDA